MNDTILRWSMTGAVLLATGCPGDPEPSSSDTTGEFPMLTSEGTSSGTTTADTNMVTTTSTGTTGSTSSSGTGDTTEGNDTQSFTFDLGVLPDAPEFDQGCRKVDFLFVIDNSGSMTAQQMQLQNSFPGFITAMQATLEDSVDSYHVGVITSDNYNGNAPGCQTLGDLVSKTAGGNSSNMDCTPFAEGHRFATEMDDLTTKFECIGRVGTSGSGTEQPITALLASFDPAKRGVGGCNEAFLRDDAILVVVVITDDPPAGTLDDANLMTDTSTWYDSVVAAKNGDPEAMVVIGFVPWMNVSCVPLNIESPNLVGFVQSFGAQGVLASVCEPDYGPIFAQAVDTIVTTCENFEPPA
ncbi:vWA domain-containing protein [Paraliomyxa miuraensis]|uniref:vWA domain-containing protein n=1 Tax=Paraliomyxa miuraensis TaxID=376150 RepID=UPI00224FE775|nr:vWA domain-containing protein [Paraliomyxa miuraensis]MCX4241933.1 VWA domain-containing protein [Paraliomyxa miuraensis]